MANPSVPATANFPIAPPQANLPLIDAHGRPTMWFFQFLQLIYASIQGGGGIIDLLSQMPPPDVANDPDESGHGAPAPANEPVVAWTPLASAGTTLLGSVPSDNILLTGAVAITSFGPSRPGQRKTVRVQDGCLLTWDATALILPNDGKSLLTRANDTFTAYGLGGSNWLVAEFQPATVVAFGPVRFHSGATTYPSGNLTPYTDDAALTVGALDAASLKALAVYRSDVLPTKTGAGADYVYASNEFRWGRELAGVWTPAVSLMPDGSLVPVTTNTVDLGTTLRRWRAGWFSGDINGAGVLNLQGSQVMAARDTGWTAMTGTATKGGFDTGTVTLPQLAQVVKAVLDAGIAQGWIGA